ncbi:hypothetical protein [Sorangium sp. So ce887]|uniref:hypothetical protein n=1 Tax=Sorangium sp. So ce887 TaxID=3133324 RepID=UPI003F646186
MENLPSIRSFLTLELYCRASSTERSSTSPGSSRSTPTLDGAIADALGRGALSAQSVAHVLDQATRAAGAPPPLEHVMSDDPRIHGLRITPHALGRYDALGARDPEEPHE